MKIFLVLAHPSPQSFNHALAHAARARLESLGHDVVFHDLYAEDFDPVLPAAEIHEDAALPENVSCHCRQIAATDGIVVVHPNWWGQPPAVLTGWVDRVIRPGVAYRFLEGDSGEGVPLGLLKARAAVVLNTSNTRPERERGVFHDPLDTIWKNCIFGLCGVPVVVRKTFGVVVESTQEQREKWLVEAGDMMEKVFPAQ